MTPKERYEKLKEHLKEENPLLVDVIEEYRKLDQLAYDLGFLPKDKTFTSSISWWPLISVLGTFSAGKSSFINEYLGKKVQDTGNQAVDDKFTVICYTSKEETTTLPGVALDADPRFPFYNISKQIEKIDPGERNINRYLQLKAVKSEPLKGKIFIDSPGFDADVQRDITLKITDHIVDLSDLVLIFFDARHPEPGAMRDTLNQLVEIAKSHIDSDKVLYILNQIDTCAKEDNLEEIIGAWQRALSQKGIVSGKFYAIYNESLAKIEHPQIEARLKRKRDEDLAAIEAKIENVVIDRAYRIVKNIESKAKELQLKIPELLKALGGYKRAVLLLDLLVAVGLAGAWYYLKESVSGIPLIVVLIAAFVLLHLFIRSKLRGWYASKMKDMALREAFSKQTKWYRPILLIGAGLGGKKYQERFNRLIQSSKSFIQKLNDQYISMHQSSAQDRA